MYFLIKKFYIIYLLLGASFFSYADDPIPVNVHQRAFVITLPTNPTTGYHWAVMNYDTNLLTLEASQYKKSKTHLMGASGEMMFTFNLNQGINYPKSTEIRLQYSRPWDNSQAITKIIKVNFVN